MIDDVYLQMMSLGLKINHYPDGHVRNPADVPYLSWHVAFAQTTSLT